MVADPPSPGPSPVPDLDHGYELEEAILSTDQEPNILDVAAEEEVLEPAFFSMEPVGLFRLFQHFMLANAGQKEVL